MARAGEIEHGALIAPDAEAIWNWSSPAGRARAARRAELIIQASGMNDRATVLELGCGTGLFTEYFARTGARVVAVDISPDLLDRARAKSNAGAVAFREEDAERLSFSDESFDAVVGSSILHHLDVDNALTEIRRVLRPGGRLSFAEPNMMNPQIALQRSVPWIRRWAGESPEETAFFRWRLRDQLVAFGFRDVSVRTYDFLHPVVPRPFVDAVNRVGKWIERVPIVREIAGSMIIRAVR